jgi:excisionase family DNA binding protein
MESRRNLAAAPDDRLPRLVQALEEVEAEASGLSSAEALELLGRSSRLDAALRGRYLALTVQVQAAASASSGEPATNGPRYLDPAEASAFLGVSKSTILRLEKAGRLTSCRPSDGVVRFDREELEEFMTRSGDGSIPAQKEGAR